MKEIDLRKFPNTSTKELCRIFSIDNPISIEFLDKKVIEYNAELLGVKLTGKYDDIFLIIKSLNEGWWPNWDDENEYKYYNWWIMKDGFLYNSVLCLSTHTHVPSALCLKSEELAKYCGKMFITLYKNYNNYKP